MALADENSASSAFAGTGRGWPVRLLAKILQRHFFTAVADRVIHFAEPASLNGAFDGVSVERF